MRLETLPSDKLPIFFLTLAIGNKKIVTHSKKLLKHPSSEELIELASIICIGNSKVSSAIWI
jgi:hypothetical protein